MNAYEELRLLLATLGEGEQRASELCPFCRGGRSGEKTLSILRHFGNNGAYHCNRANCGREGYIGERFTTNYTPTNRPKEFQPRIFDGVVEELPEHVGREIERKYGWSSEDVIRTGCGWSPEYQRSVWKIVAPDGSLRGIELRSHNPTDRHKTLHYRHTSDPWVGYVGTGVDQQEREGVEGGRGGSATAGTNGQHGTLVAVEDLLSAYRVANVYPAAAIMGSHLTFDTMMDLMKVSENIVLCLDRDATQKAEKFARRYAFICPGLVHVPLQRDLKYENNDTIREIIGYA